VAETRTNLVAKRIEIGANIAIVVAACLLIALCTKSLLRRSPDSPQAIAVGARLSLDNVTWQANRNVVLAISTTCHFCNESASFYRDLVSECRRRNVPTIALLPQPVAESESYLQERQILVDDVRQAQLPDVQIYATPTVLIVDRRGIVQRAWVGKLPPERENEILSKLRQP
jgi:hypothetical protein